MDVKGMHASVSLSKLVLAKVQVHNIREEQSTVQSWPFGCV